MLENLFNLFRRTRQTRHIKVKHLAYAEDMPEVLVSLKTFRKASRGQLIYETAQELAFINEDGATRYVKPNAKPHIVRTNDIQIDPTHVSCRIKVSKTILFEIAVRERVMVVETPEAFIIPLGVSFIAPKGKS